MMHGNLRSWLALIAIAPGAVGCGHAPALPKGYPAEGTVAYQGGVPLKGGMIEFKSDADPLLRVVGQVDERGEFKLRTIKDAEADGAPPGEYQVVVTPERAGGRGLASQKGPTSIVLEKKVTVEEKANRFRIELPGPEK